MRFTQIVDDHGTQLSGAEDKKEDPSLDQKVAPTKTVEMKDLYFCASGEKYCQLSHVDLSKVWHKCHSCKKKIHGALCASYIDESGLSSPKLYCYNCRIPEDGFKIKEAKSSGSSSEEEKENGEGAGNWNLNPHDPATDAALNDLKDSDDLDATTAAAIAAAASNNCDDKDDLAAAAAAFGGIYPNATEVLHAFENEVEGDDDNSNVQKGSGIEQTTAVGKEEEHLSSLTLQTMKYLKTRELLTEGKKEKTQKSGRRKTGEPPSNPEHIKDFTTWRKMGVVLRHVRELQEGCTWKECADRNSNPKSQHFFLTYDEFVEDPKHSQNGRRARSKPISCFYVPLDFNEEAFGKHLVAVGKQMQKKLRSNYRIERESFAFRDHIFGKGRHYEPKKGETTASLLKLIAQQQEMIDHYKAMERKGQNNGNGSCDESVDSDCLNEQSTL